MATANERKALWFFIVVALSGSAVRVWRSDPAVPSPAIDGQLRRLDSARAQRQVRRARTSGVEARKGISPPAPGSAIPGPVDLDRASAREMEQLPGIGPALAARIVANRDSGGPFGAIETLCAVRGVGPSLAEKLRPLVTFTGPPRPVSVACDGGSKSSRSARAARHRK